MEVLVGDVRYPCVQKALEAVWVKFCAYGTLKKHLGWSGAADSPLNIPQGEHAHTCTLTKSRLKEKEGRVRVHSILFSFLFTMFTWFYLQFQRFYYFRVNQVCNIDV